MTTTPPTPETSPSAQQWRSAVAQVLTCARDRSQLLTDAVDDDDLVRQHSPLMSPLVWDLAHVGNQEELWLVRDVGGRAPVRGDIDQLYDALKHARADRPALPLLGRRRHAAMYAWSATRCWTSWTAAPWKAAGCSTRGSRSRWWPSMSSSTTRRCWQPTS